MRFERGAVSVALAGCVLLAGAPGCRDSGHPGGNQNACSLVCDGDAGCPNGFGCLDGCCVQTLDGGVHDAGPAPAIVVEPDTLSYGYAPFYTDTALEAIVSNVGEADLEIFEIRIEELDSLREFHSSQEGVYDPPFRLSPGASVNVQVALHPEDREVDAAELQIHSNDPDDPVVTVPLVNDCKCCDPDLQVCVLDAALTAPVPFLDCAVDYNAEPILDFGLLSEDASRIVAVRNGADGIFPLTIDDVHVTDNTGMGGAYTIELFRLEEDPQTGEPMEVAIPLPVHLLGPDPVLGQQEGRLFIRLWLSMEYHYAVPEESLIIGSDIPGGDLEIPIIGLYYDCPPGCWDLNGDPWDGCEFCCTFSGPYDSCLEPGVDRNCDGVVEHEDIEACTVYYRDADGDTYGVTGDQRCLCWPESVTDHTALEPGDCNDADPLIHPSATEVCDGTDNDCDGTVDNGCP